MITIVINIDVALVGDAVAGLRDIEKLAPTLKRLGERHNTINKNIGPAHYKLIGDQLIVTLRQGLGHEFTPNVEASWVAIYGVLSKSMQAS